jgi:hypothetical protein
MKNDEESKGSGRRQATKKSGRYFLKMKAYTRINKIL